MAIPDAFTALLDHPSPAIHFPAHESAGTPERTLLVRHTVNSPASPDEIAWLKERTRACPSAQAELVEFYSRYNGAGLCCIQDPDIGEWGATFYIPPIAEMRSLTQDLEPDGDDHFMVEDMDDIYAAGRFLVIVATPCEGTRLSLFTEGQLDGVDMSGKLFYASMDPELAFDEPVADSFFGMLETFARDPVGFQNHIGSPYSLRVGERMWGDVPDAYVAEHDTR